MANKIEEISLADIKGDNDTKSQPRIENVSYVASYNWIDKDTPTISVPGKPSHSFHQQTTDTITLRVAIALHDTASFPYLHR